MWLIRRLLRNPSAAASGLGDGKRYCNFYSCSDGPGCFRVRCQGNSRWWCENISPAWKLQKLIPCLCVERSIGPCLEAREPLTRFSALPRSCERGLEKEGGGSISRWDPRSLCLSRAYRTSFSDQQMSERLRTGLIPCYAKGNLEERVVVSLWIGTP